MAAAVGVAAPWVVQVAVGHQGAVAHQAAEEVVTSSMEGLRQQAAGTQAPRWAGVERAFALGLAALALTALAGPG